MDAIGWSALRSAGSSWRFKPRGVLRQNRSICIHEPHPNSSQAIPQVNRTGGRLKRTYGMSMENFVIDRSRQDAAVPHSGEFPL